jgi:hypothetical protein
MATGGDDNDDGDGAMGDGAMGDSAMGVIGHGIVGKDIPIMARLAEARRRSKR